MSPALLPVQMSLLGLGLNGFSFSVMTIFVWDKMTAQCIYPLTYGLEIVLEIAKEQALSHGLFSHMWMICVGSKT